MKSLSNIFIRLYSIFVGRSHAAIDALESPEEKLKSFVEQLTAELKKLHEAVTLAVIEEKKMKLKVNDFLTRANDWEKKAILAVSAGQDDLAREALQAKEQNETQATAIKTEWERHQASVAQLRTALKTAQQRVEKEKREYAILLARAQTASTMRDINSRLNGINLPESPIVLIEALNEKILAVEAETEVLAESSELEKEIQLAAEIEQLGKSEKIDNALADLKRRLTDSAASSAQSA